MYGAGPLSFSCSKFRNNLTYYATQISAPPALDVKLKFPTYPPCDTLELLNKYCYLRTCSHAYFLPTPKIRTTLIFIEINSRFWYLLLHWNGEALFAFRAIIRLTLMCEHSRYIAFFCHHLMDLVLTYRLMIEWFFAYELNCLSAMSAVAL